MRYLAVSDIHLNVNRRLEDTVDALNQVAKIIEDKKVNVVFVLGDVYTSRRPHSKEKQLFERWIRRITTPRPNPDGVGYVDVVRVCLLKGNHDEYPNSDVHSYSEFTELQIPNVTVFDNPTTIDGFFLGHLLLKEAKLGPIDYQNSNCMSSRELITKYPNRKAYLLGDVHKAQTIQKDPLVIYAGSINRVDFGERNDEKSVLLIDDNPEFKCTRIPLKSRRMIQYDFHCFEYENQWPLSDAEINDAIVKIVFHGTSEEINETVNESELRRSLESRCEELIIQYKIQKESIARDERVNENITPQQALELFLEQLDLTTEEKVAIIELSQKVTEDATA